MRETNDKVIGARGSYSYFGCAFADRSAFHGTERTEASLNVQKFSNEDERGPGAFYGRQMRTLFGTGVRSKIATLWRT